MMSDTNSDTKMVLNQVQQYYGSELKSQKDLKTNACCSSESIPEQHKAILKEIHPEVLNRFYGCGSPIPFAIENCTVLDLGCGTGRDTYLASKLVGPKGYVIGIDMTDEQLEVPRKVMDQQMETFGFDQPNVSFRTGYIEDLGEAGIKDNSVDVVISNCVINLSPDKQRVISEIFRVLKPGGELYFSDVFADRRVPEHLREDPVLYGECLSGAFYTEDFRRLMAELGCPDYRMTSQSPIEIRNNEIEQKVGMIQFQSRTLRAFKLENLEDICEDYGQVAVYNGTIGKTPHRFVLDDHHVFETGKPVLVCGNTAAMLEKTRFGSHFRVDGDRSLHYGPFDCGNQSNTMDSGEQPGTCC
ncbi:MAG: methyltransferase domain-containing protein [Balneolales bacterium]